MTKDEFIMRGVSNSKDNYLMAPLEVNEVTSSVLLGCHSLVQVCGKIVGDPIELAVFKSMGGSIQGTTIVSKSGSKIYQLRRYAFDSILKRMSVLVTVQSRNLPNAQFNRVVTKGAPEVMKSLFKAIPENYEEQYTHFAKLGYRILALGYNDSNQFNSETRREELEKELQFCGFLVVETPLKKRTEKYIQELLEAEYQICIITGDHYYTTAKVSKDLKLGPSKIAFFKVSLKSGQEFETPIFLNSNECDKFLQEECSLYWEDEDKNIVSRTLSIDNCKELSQKFTLGICGKELHLLLISNLFPNKHEMFQFIKLYCRVNPMQKDDIIKMLMKAGLNPSMCGDGSNDVGALKRAVIGVALLNSEDNDKSKKNQPFNIFSLEDDSTIKSGEVTAAAPFTSKSGSIKCIKNIFIQGRCTLVITFQMYKILALNCLLTAYSMSVLALKGIKFSDYQSTYMGFVVAFLFLMLSKAEPLKTIRKEKPPYSIFNWHFLISIIGQASTHLLCMITLMNLTEVYDPISVAKVRSLEDPYAPSLVNSVIFIFTGINQTINFIVNYQGEPFMKNLTTNTWLQRLSIFVVGISLVLIFDLSKELTEALELIPLPEDIHYKITFVVLLIGDFILCYLFENWKKVINLLKK